MIVVIPLAVCVPGYRRLTVRARRLELRSKCLMILTVVRRRQSS